MLWTEPVCLTAFIWGEGKEPCASANLRLIAHDSKPVLMASDITAWQGLAAQLYADMKQGRLQTTIYPVWYLVSLDCIGLYPHISRSWVAMLATPTLISAEQEIQLLFPDLPKPSWVPLCCSQHVLLTMPTALEWPPQQTLRCTPGVQGKLSTKFRGHPGRWLGCRQAHL